MSTKVELFERAMAAGSQSEADEIFESLVQAKLSCACKKCLSDPAASRVKAEAIVREALGYMAGYYCNNTRERVERLFKCEHPIFGAIAKKGAVTADEAFAIGLKLGAESKAGANDE